MELLLGCGRSRDKRLFPSWRPKEWQKLVTLDMDPGCGADIRCRIEDGLPFANNTFDEIHAYEVLEHIRSQGDWRGFFQDFAEIYRVLKPFGLLCASTPLEDGPTAWSDPGHTRVIAPATLQFLDQAQYADVIGKGSLMTDYRHVWKGDFRTVYIARDESISSNFWILQAIKPPMSVPRVRVDEGSTISQLHLPDEVPATV
jgi:SAM-dependent methyltransferase